jgi:hypothetical protein
LQKRYDQVSQSALTFDDKKVNNINIISDVNWLDQTLGF